MNPPELAAAFERIPLLRKLRPDDFEISALPGYTNHNFRLCSGDQDWVLRLPKAETNQYIDRNAEAHNQAQAAGLHLAPRTLWQDQHGISLTPTLPGRSLRCADLDDDGQLARLAASLNRLHRSGLQFRGQVKLAGLLERYFALVPAERQAGLSTRMEQARAQIEWLEDHDALSVASHNDLVLENWILDGDRTWLIDWEFSAMASPYWDLAILCNAAALSPDRAHQLLDAYCADAVQMKESVLSVYRFLLQLLSDCWMIALVPGTE